MSATEEKTGESEEKTEAKSSEAGELDLKLDDPSTEVLPWETYMPLHKKVKSAIAGIKSTFHPANMHSFGIFDVEHLRPEEFQRYVIDGAGEIKCQCDIFALSAVVNKKLDALSDLASELGEKHEDLAKLVALLRYVQEHRAEEEAKDAAFIADEDEVLKLEKKVETKKLDLKKRKMEFSA